MAGNPLTMASFAEEVRAYMRDFPELNRLISGEETSTRMVSYCIVLALDEFNNGVGFRTSYVLADFPSRVILLNLTIIHILTSVGLLKSRNRFNYSDGGWSSETEIQDDLYQRWISLLRSQTDSKAEALKIKLNIDRGWGGGVHSEYQYLHSWYDYDGCY